MSGSDFRAQKPSKLDKKRLRNIYANNPKTIVYQYFEFSSILRFEKARKFNIQCQEVILETKNHQNWTKRDCELFTQITLNRSYINILDFHQFLGLKRLETSIFNVRK